MEADLPKHTISLLPGDLATVAWETDYGIIRCDVSTKPEFPDSRLTDDVKGQLALDRAMRAMQTIVGEE
jgi:hypothetical protein